MMGKSEDLFIEVLDVVKDYPVPNINPFKPNSSFRALKGINLQIPRGSISCVLGANGAGKTTLIKILADLIIPDSGSIIGPSPNGIYSAGLVTPNDRAFYWRLTGRQNLNFFASLYNIADISGRVKEVLEDVGLREGADRPFRHYSAGMKQKMNIARALLPNPDLYLLDEPTNHLDPLAKEELWDFITTILIKKKGATVILCTHDLEETAILSDYIALLHEGTILAQGNPQLLKQQVQNESHYCLKYIHMPEKWRLENNPLLISEMKGEAILHIEEDKLSPLLNNFLKTGGTIKEVTKKEPLLMDVMKHFIGNDNE